MSTRANVVLTESYTYKAGNGRQVSKTDKVYFYRHHDGYPETVLPDLLKLTDWCKRGLIRNNVQQGGPWLILIGAMEYNTIPAYQVVEKYGDVSTFEDPKDWKCGAYELTNGIHGDAEYLYNIDMRTLEIKVQAVSYDEHGKQSFIDIEI